MIEYPKALYLNGTCLNVDGAEQEDVARADGYADWTADFDRLNAPTEEQTPTRKPRATKS